MTISKDTLKKQLIFWSRAANKVFIFSYQRGNEAPLINVAE